MSVLVLISKNFTFQASSIFHLYFNVQDFFVHVKKNFLKCHKNILLCDLPELYCFSFHTDVINPFGIPIGLWWEIGVKMCFPSINSQSTLHHLLN